jgi:hypothetical protein
LEKAADGAGHSVGEEIRRRLERTFAEEQIDPVTRELATGIIRLADLIQLDQGSAWHAGMVAHQAFAAAVAQRIDGYKPVTDSAPGLASRMLGLSVSDEDADAAGRTLERYDRRSHADWYLGTAQDAHARTMTAAARRKLRDHASKKDDKS